MELKKILSYVSYFISLGSFGLHKFLYNGIQSSIKYIEFVMQTCSNKNLNLDKLISKKVPYLISNNFSNIMHYKTFDEIVRIIKQSISDCIWLTKIDCLVFTVFILFTVINLGLILKRIVFDREVIGYEKGISKFKGYLGV